MTKTAHKPAMQHEEDAITLLTEDHKKVKKTVCGVCQTRQGQGKR
ncbi:hypothetical protein [Methylicorpusculum oleiharenae]|nr:hypothetical protein [Methylicorpusculum oleiharenae]